MDQQTTPITLKGFPEEESYSWEDAHEAFIGVSVKIAEDAAKNQESSETGADVVILVDISGSMRRKGKFAAAKACVHYVCNTLRKGVDRLTVAVFNDEVNPLDPEAPEDWCTLTDESEAHTLKLLEQLKCGGSTSIGDALRWGVKMLNARERVSEVDRLPCLLLLTDGHCNAGDMRSKRSIVGYVEEQWSATRFDEDDLPNEPPRLAVIGLGSDHNSSLLGGIALSSVEGVYSFVQEVEELGTTFGEWLYGCMTTVARRVWCKVEASSGCRIMSMDCNMNSVPSSNMKGACISLGSMYPGETREFMFETSIRAQISGMKTSDLQHLFSITLGYTKSNGETAILHENVEVRRPLKLEDGKVGEEADVPFANVMDLDEVHSEDEDNALVAAEEEEEDAPVPSVHPMFRDNILRWAVIRLLFAVIFRNVSDSPECCRAMACKCRDHMIAVSRLYEDRDRPVPRSDIQDQLLDDVDRICELDFAHIEDVHWYKSITTHTMETIYVSYIQQRSCGSYLPMMTFKQASAVVAEVGMFNAISSNGHYSTPSQKEAGDIASQQVVHLSQHYT